VTGPELEKIIELDASPEQVWAAIATGPGISAWFVPSEVEPRVGGTISADFGGGAVSTGRVTAWEPGHRFAHGSAEPPAEGPDYAFEYLVEGRDGGGTVVRFVQSGFAAENWQDEYDSFEKGWALFFGNLRTYLADFDGLPVRNAVSMAFAPVGAAQAWPVLHRALGLPGRPAVGETVALTGPVPIDGVVDVATDEFLGVRAERSLHRFGAEGQDGCGLSAYHYFYGEPVDAATVTKAWDSWLTSLFEARE
jgi:uncharacterized protein YndB with AHSA1/START domain